MEKSTQKQKSTERKRFSSIREGTLFRYEARIIIQVEKFLKEILIEQKNKGYIGIYWPLKGEVDLRSLRQSLGNKVALPAVKTRHTITYHSWSDESLGVDSLKIPAPTNQKSLSPEEISVLFVPALAMDKNGFRLGYGGGYFDRLRSKKDWHDIPSFAVLPESCISENPLPKDSWDIPFDGWVSETGLHEIQPNQSLVRLLK